MKEGRQVRPFFARFRHFIYFWILAVFIEIVSRELGDSA